MFGKNKLAKKVDGDGLSLSVQDIFSTIQGEGPFAGRPAIFLRLAGCNLACYFCDTDFESKAKDTSVDAIVKQVEMMAGRGKVVRTNLVVVTGGEPMRQNIHPLCQQLIRLGYQVQIETAGTLWVRHLEHLVTTGWLTIVCSPKTGKVDPMIATYCHDWKYLIQQDQVDEKDGLPNRSTQIRGHAQNLYRPDMSISNQTIWLQPCEAYKIDTQLTAWERFGTSDQDKTNTVRDVPQSDRNTALAAYLAMKYNYRISIQVHKLLHLP